MPFCMVSGCSSKSNKTTSSKGIILHVFPSDVDRIKVWLRQTGQDFGNINTFARRVLDSKKTNIFRICSEHFTPGSYVTNISKKILRDDAMPTIFPNRDIVLSPYSKKPRMDAGGIAGHNVKPMPRGDDSTPGDLYHKTRGNGRQASPYLGIKIVKVDTDLNCSMKDPDTSSATDLDTEDCSYIDHKVFTCDKSCQCPEHGNDFESKLWKIEKVTFSSQNLIPKNQITLLDSANPDDFELVPVETSGCEVAGKALQRAGVQLAVDRTFIMFESCLDDVLKQVPCACGERICAVDKVLEGTYLCAIGVCFGGHKSFTWKSQPVRALISVDSIQTALQFSRGNGDSNKTSLIENQQNQPPSTSPDASRSSIIPERCFSPLYSQNAAQEHHITHKCQDDSLAVIKEEKYLYERSVGPCKEVEIPPEISTDSRDTRSSQRSGQAEEEKERNEIKDEDILLGIDTNEQSNRYTPERFPCTQYFEDSTQEEKKISQDYKDKNSAKVDDEAGMEETRMRGYELCKMEEISPEIGTDGRYRRFEVEHCSMQSPDEMEDDDITSDSSGEHFTPNPCSLPQPAEVSPDVGCETFPGVTQRAELVKHQTVHITAKPFSCSECGKGFTKKRNLVEHQNVHTGTNQYSCSECGKCFARRRNLISHQRIHSAEKPFSCTVCGKCFIQKQQLIAHQRTHTAEKPFSCSECGKSFTQRVTLISHQRTHTGERPFSCLECGKCYTNRSHLSTHQLVHMSVRMFSCPQCGKCFTRRGSLISHQRSHTGEKPFSCSECGKCFTRRASLIVHQRTHTGEKPYSCLECGRCFNEKANLVTHHMVHTGDRPYSCSVCGKGFSTKSNLVKHHQVHISIKMHACSECEKQFPNKLTLISHLSSHSRQKAPGSETIASE